MLSPRTRWLLATLLAAAVGVPLGWRLWPSASKPPERAATPPPPPPPVEDDLELVAAVFDGAAPSEAHDLLVAGADGVYLARGSDHAILAMPKGGGAARTLASLEGPAFGMALAAGFLWVTTETTRGNARAARGVVLRVKASDGSRSEVAAGFGAPSAVASDGEWVFVVDADARDASLLPGSQVVRVQVRGGERTVLGRSDGPIDAIALDGDFLYWCDRLEGTIVAVPRTGGAPHAVATRRGLPEQIVAWEGTLFWVERRSESLWTMPATGGEPHRLAQDFAGFVHLAADGRGAFWNNEAAVESRFGVLEVEGAGSERPASTAVPEIDALASDGERRYWDRGGEVQTLPE